jgi:pimeloyl-ACP methyl ester carboxylesterase
MPVIEINDTKLEYIEKGHGDPVIFVHGSLGDLRTWSLQIEPFSKLYRVIAYSRRYHYPNAEPGESLDYTVNLHAEDLASLIKGLGLQKPHILSSSYGAYIALVLAANHPELVRSITLGEPPLLPWLEGSKEGMTLMAAFTTNVWEPTKKAFQRGDTEEGVRTFINGVLGQEAFDNLPTSIRAALMENAPEMKAEVLSPGFFSKFTCDDAKKIKTPTFLLTGEISPPMFRYIIKELRRCMPEAYCTVILKSSHTMQAGDPEAYNTQVLRFLSRH